MKGRWDAFSWSFTLLALVIVSLILVQLAIRAAFASAAPLALEVPVVHPKAADYGPDDSKPKLAALDPKIISEARAEDERLRQTRAQIAALRLPTLNAPLNPLVPLMEAPAS